MIENSIIGYWTIDVSWLTFYLAKVYIISWIYNFFLEKPTDDEKYAHSKNATRHWSSNKKTASTGGLYK